MIEAIFLNLIIIAVVGGFIYAATRMALPVLKLPSDVNRLILFLVLGLILLAIFLRVIIPLLRVAL